MELFDLTGKTAIITGSSRGIGEAIAVRMAQHGANVIISSRKEDACDAVTEAINAKYPGRAKTIAAHIGDKDALQNLVDETEKAFGQVDILVCNAAVNPYIGPSAGCPDDAFDRVIEWNVKSNHWLCQMVAPDMVVRGGGSIMITSSVGAFEPSLQLGTYAISKLAVIGLVRNLAAEYGAKKIRVNAICPAIIKTDFAKALWDDDTKAKDAIAKIPLGRLGEPEDLQGLAVFLASNASSYITGQAMTICGGGYMWR